MPSSVRTAPRRNRLSLEYLEDRHVPASLAIDSVELADSSDVLIDQNITPLYTGEQMFFRITYTTTDLPPDAQYGISITMNEIVLTASGITAGAGISGDTQFVVNTAALFDGLTWYAQPGQSNELETSLFSQQGFNASAYSYDVFESFAPTILELPFSLSRPISGSQNNTWVVVNNLDQNPDFNFFGTEGIADYRDGFYTTDAQDTTDFQLVDFTAADAGVQVLAAGGGTIVDLMDGQFDRNYDLTPPYLLAVVDRGNYVTIDHEDGWFTSYSGLRSGSLRFNVGDTVKAGEILGLVAGSGIPSQGPRLSFSFFFDRGSGATSLVDPFIGQYWSPGAQPSYQGDTPVSMNVGVTNYDFTTDLTARAERPVQVDAYAPGNTVYFWSTGTQPLDSVATFTWTDPSGGVAMQNTAKATKVFDRSVDTFTLPANAAAGTWRVTYSVDGKQLAQESFTVSANPSTPAVYATAQQPIGPPIGDFYLVPGRTTSLNIGSWNQGSISPQVTINFTNIGSAPLILDTPLTTEGIRFFDFPTEPIAPGAVVSFGIGFDGTVIGTLSGQFRIPTNDPNVPFFDGKVNGISRDASGSGGDSGTGVQPGDPNTGNNPLLGTADGIRTIASPNSPGLSPGAPSSIRDNSFAVGTNPGTDAQVVVFTQDGAERFRINAFPGFTGGVRTAMADFDRDGVSDLVVGTGPGRSTEVQILNGRTNRLMFQIQPFEENFIGGVFVSAGDINGDGVPDLVITPDQGGGPRVRAFDGVMASVGQTGTIMDFFGIDDVNFRGGARAAVGDINGDGRPDLVVAAGFGGGPRVAVFDGQTLRNRQPRRLFSDFFAFELGLRDGVFVTVGDVNSDGLGDLIIGGGPGGAPRVAAFSGGDLLVNTKTELANFFAGNPASRGGVSVAVRDLNADGQPDLLAASGSGKFSQLVSYPLNRISEPNPRAVLNLSVFPDFSGGVFVG